MRIERLPKSIADPACGNGAILDVLRDEGGHIVHGCDIRDYGWPHTVIRDYLEPEPIFMGDLGIVTNPPYRLAEAFIRKAISDGARYHAWLLRTNFLESIGRFEFFQKHPPSKVWISSRRLPMMHHADYDGPKCDSSNQAFAWFFWREGCAPEPNGWFDWLTGQYFSAEWFDPRTGVASRGTPHAAGPRGHLQRQGT